MYLNIAGINTKIAVAMLKMIKLILGRMLKLKS